jgi:hypothetical protein
MSSSISQVDKNTSLAANSSEEAAAAAANEEL